MKAIVCEMCGCNEFIKQDGFFVCQGCRTKYSLEEAKKLFVEVSGRLEIDNSKKLENYYQLARRAKETDNAEDAIRFYDLIMQEDPNSWEAYFYTLYYRALRCNLDEIADEISKIINNEYNIFLIIKNTTGDFSREQFDAVNQIVDKLIRLSQSLFDKTVRGYNSPLRTERPDLIANNACAIRDMLCKTGDILVSLFYYAYGDFAVACWQVAISKQAFILYFPFDNCRSFLYQMYNQRIKDYSGFDYGAYRAEEARKQSSF